MLAAADHELPFQDRELSDVSTATQNDAAPHATETRSLLPSMSDGADHEAPFHITACPAESVAAERVAE